MSTQTELLARLRRQCAAKPRAVGDLERNLALWLAVTMGTPRKASSFNIDSGLALDAARLREVPYLAALGFLAAVGERFERVDQLKDELRRVLQRHSHTLEGEGFADDVLAFCGLALLAEALDDNRAIAVTDRAARDIEAKDPIGTLVLALARKRGVPPSNSALCTAIELLIRHATRDHGAGIPQQLWSNLLSESNDATGLNAILALVVLERAVLDSSNTVVNMEERAQVDLALVIALREEFRVLHSRIRDQSTPVEQDGQHYYLFDIPCCTGAYRCVATFVGEMATTFSGPVAQKAITQWKPKTAVSVGIAAGIHKDVRVGDALVATQVDAYLDAARAIDPASIEGAATSKFDLARAGNSFQADAILVGRTRNFEFVHSKRYETWRAQAEQRRVAIAKNYPLPEGVRIRPELADGHLACGPIVGASKSFTAWLHQGDRSYRALQMESSAVMACAHLSSDTKAFVIRGISDFGDERKAELDQIGDGVLREYAMENALDLLWALAAAGIFEHHAERSTDQQVTPPVERPPSSLATSHPAGSADELVTERRVAAAQRLWGTILAMRDAIPLGMLNYFDVITEEEFRRLRRSEEAKFYIDRIDDNAISSMMYPAAYEDIEFHRPILGEALWNKFFSYRAFLGRVCHVTCGRLGDGKAWYRDRATLRLATDAIGEIALLAVMTLPAGRFNAVRIQFESDMAAQLGPLLVG